MDICFIVLFCFIFLTGWVIVMLFLRFWWNPSIFISYLITLSLIFIDAPFFLLWARFLVQSHKWPHLASIIHKQDFTLWCHFICLNTLLEIATPIGTSITAHLPCFYFLAKIITSINLTKSPAPLSFDLSYRHSIILLRRTVHNNTSSRIHCVTRNIFM